MEGKYFVGGCGVLAIGFIVGIALLKDINGTVTSAGIGAIVIIVGYGFGYYKGKKATQEET